MDHGILFDHARTSRIGLPEAVFCEGKPLEAVEELLSRFGRGSGRPILFTRLAPDIFAMMPEQIRASYDYDPLSRTAFGETLPARSCVAVDKLPKGALVEVEVIAEVVG